MWNNILVNSFITNIEYNHYFILLTCTSLYFLKLNLRLCFAVIYMRKTVTLFAEMYNLHSTIVLQKLLFIFEIDSLILPVNKGNLPLCTIMVFLFAQTPSNLIKLLNGWWNSHFSLSERKSTQMETSGNPENNDYK